MKTTIVRPAGGDSRALRAWAVIFVGLVCALTMSRPLSAGGQPETERDRQILLMHADGTYETGYIHSDMPPPDWGAFAEKYEGSVLVGGVVLDLIRPQGGMENTAIDVYIWSDGGGQPSSVMAIVRDVEVTNVPYWPDVGRNVVNLGAPVWVEGAWWVGFWEHDMAYYIAADLDGPGGGTPMMKIPPGAGYPTGWQSVDLVWGPTAALGIGAEVDLPTPAEPTTWGSIKALYR